MKRSQKVRSSFVWLALVALLALVISACAAPVAPAPAEAPAEEAAPAEGGDAAAAEPTATPDWVAIANASNVSDDPDVIDWWHIATNEDHSAFFQSVADEYMAANPDAKISIVVLENEAYKQRLAAMMQAGAPPDLFQGWGGGVLNAYADGGLLGDFAADFTGEWRDSITAASVVDSLFSRNGAVYGIPWNWGGVGIFYNKDLFEQAGLDPENPPATWPEFLEAVEALKAAGITPLTVGQRDRWPGHFWWTYFAIREGGKAAFDAAASREGSFADPAFVQAGQDLLDLIALNPFPEGYLGFNYGDSATAFGNGEAAMELMGQWHPNVQRDNSASGEGIGDALAWMPFPAFPDGQGGAMDLLGGGDAYVVGKDAPATTVGFLKYLTSPEVQMRQVEVFGVPPTTAEAEALITDPVMQQILAARNAAEYQQLYYDQYLPPAVGQAVLDAVDGLFNGTMTAEEAAQVVEEAAAAEMD
jgi:raffinose/stachyose/melibiose transport system substrate-binding protein